MNDSRNTITRRFNSVLNSELLTSVTSKFLTVNTYISDAYKYLKTSLDASTQIVRPTADVILMQFGFYLTSYLVFCYILYLSRILFRNRLAKSKYFDSSAQRILLITAHPDNECMFFGPLIVRMVKNNKCLYLLCLSTGDADGKTQMRKKELWSSCKLLGMRSENIFLCNSSLRVKDVTMWKSDNIATLIHEYIEILDIDTVVTFDKYGVNGHDNHIAVFRAVSFLNLRKQLPINCHIFLLDSLGLVRKYSSAMDVALSLFLSKNVFVLPPYEHELVKKALRKHKTGLHWCYTRLYMMFSRYTYVNSLSELPRYSEYQR